MKLTFLFYLLIQLNLYFLFTLRIKDQPLLLEAFQDVLDPKTLDIINDESLDQESEFSVNEICNSLMQYLLVFGENAIWTYQNCREKYILLGKQNPLIQQDQPKCFSNLVPALCENK